MTMDDQGYEWVEITNFEERAAGKRTFLRGKPLDPNAAPLADLKANILELADQYEANPKWLRSLDVSGLLKEMAK